MTRHSALVLATLLLGMSGATVSSAQQQIPLPPLPRGAGEIEEDAPKTFTTTSSGLQYRVLRKGKGELPKATSAVTVRYHGWLDDGTVFASSYDRRQRAELALAGLIPGWTEGMQLVAPEGMIELVIPAKLGYGDRGIPGRRPGDPPLVPPGATLHFLVELDEVK